MKKTATSTYDFLGKFPDEKSATKYFTARRWKNGVYCPYCTSKDVTKRKSRQYHLCNMCRKEFTIRTGTVFERSHIPLHKWLFAMYLMTIHRKGLSSVLLARELGITQKSAWFMLHRLRECCGDDGTMLDGIVEIDETYIGGKERNKHASKKTKGTQGRSTKTKSAVIGMRERKGRVKAMPIPDTASRTLTATIDNNIDKRALLCTDDATGYSGIKDRPHLVVKHSAREYVNGMASTNGIESVWALLKRMHYGTYHQFSVKHLHRYVNECSYRLNEGNEVMEGIASLCDKATGNRITCKQLKS